MYTTWNVTLAAGGLLVTALAAGTVSRPHGGDRPSVTRGPSRAAVGETVARADRPAAAAPAPDRPKPTIHKSAARTILDSVKATGAMAHAAMVRRIAQRYSVGWKLVMAIIASESGGDAAAVSPVGAVGLMQLMPDTAKGLGVDPFDPEQNVEGATRYLSSLLSTFGSVDLTLIAYNAGPGFALQYRQGTVELGAETRAFLMRVGRFLEPSAGAPAPGRGPASVDSPANPGAGR